MLKKFFNKRIVALMASVAVTASAVAGSYIFNTQSAYAKVTLRGIEEIASSHSVTATNTNPNPFKVIEVVPAKSDARFGYLVGGEEPVKNGKSIKDMPSTTERENWLKNSGYDPTVDPNDPASPVVPPHDEAIYNLFLKNAFNWTAYDESSAATENVKSMDIRGSFKRTEAFDGAYDNNDYSDAYRKYGSEAGEGSVEELYDEGNTSHVKLFRRTEAFREKDDYYTGNYIFSLKRLDPDAPLTMPVNTSSEPNDDPQKGNAPVANDIYNWQYFGATLITEELIGQGAITPGQFIFKTEGNPDALNYAGRIVLNDEGILCLDVYQYPVVVGGGEGQMDAPQKYGNLGDVIAILADEDTPTPAAAPEEGQGAPSIEPVPIVPPVTPEDPTPSAAPDSSGEPGGTEPSPIVAPSSDPSASASPDASPSADPSESASPDTSPSASPSASPDGEEYGFVLLSDPMLFGAPGASAVLIPVTDLVLAGATESFYIVEEKGTDYPNPFVIDELIDTDAKGMDPGPFGRKRGYSEIVGDVYNTTNLPIEKGPYYVKTNDEDPYVYNLSDPQDGEYNFLADYTMSVYQTFKYTGGFTNNEWFKRYVLDREPGVECDNLYVDVVPVTIDELSEHIEGADLIYFAGGRYPEDIDIKTASLLLDKVINDNLPVIVERSMYYANLYDENGADNAAKSERPIITTLALKLMQGSLSSWDETQWKAAYCDILGIDNYDDPYDIDDPSTPSKWRTVSEAIVTGDDGNKYGGISGKQLVADTPSADTILESKVSTIRSDLLKGVRSGHYDYWPNNDASYVQGTIFVNDDWNDELWEEKTLVIDPDRGKINYLRRVVSGDFVDSYSEEKVQSGFLAIREEYENERPIIELSSDWSLFNSTYSKATSIRYILNANNDRHAVKTSLKILDLEPLESAQYNDPSAIQAYTPWGKINSSTMKRDIIDKNWVKENLEFTGDDESISIKQMGTKEFIAKNDDLNVEYDMIYIGMDRIMMNTYFEGDGDARRRVQKTKYLLESMDGLVYSHIGDKYNNYHTSGNDITADKLVSLREYVEAGCALLLSDDFFNINTDGSISGINTTHVDISSNMYTFINEVVLKKNGDGNYIYWGKNIFRKGALEKNTGTDATGAYLSARKTFAKYLNISKLKLIVKERPREYNSVDDGGNATQQYLEKAADGEYYLNFRVELQNDAAVNIGTSDDVSYDCKLYIDLDGDGKFEDSVDTDGDGEIDFFSDEQQIGISINDGTVLPSENGTYSLSSGNEYTISKAVPRNYVGFLAWKLVFVQNQRQFGAYNNSATVRTAIQGFSAVPAPNTIKPTIKVLQLTPASDSTMENCLDLKNDPEMRALYDKVTDFDIEVTQKPVDFYITRFNNGNAGDLEYTMSYYDYLCQFDMIVLGFCDCYDFRAKPKEGETGIPFIYRDSNGIIQTPRIDANLVMRDAILAIREYALSGRSILFTHDLTSYHDWAGDENQWGYYCNYYLRDIQGMDRYNKLNNSDLTYNVDPFRLGVKIPNYESVYDTPRLKGNDTGEVSGYTDAIIVRNNSKDVALTALEETRTYVIDSSVPNRRNTVYEKVTIINEGQITQYPFFIADEKNPEFNVASTHSQYYQLNLDTSSYDKNTDDDVVVWLAISNKDNSSDGMTSLHSYYKALHNDARNNYYIFSKGNITYTGSGHSYIGQKDDGQNLDKERKLFVNTLVAAYQSGLHAPDVEFKENPWDAAPTIKNKYLPYDMVKESAKSTVVTGEWLDQTLQINFKTLNNNFKESRAELNAKYYVKGTAEEYTLRVGTNYYYEINPINDGSMKNSFKYATSAGTLMLDSNPYVLKNFTVYQATFNLSDLKLGGGGALQPKDGTTVYVHIGTEELSTGSVDTLKPTEVIRGLDINVTKLYDLY